MVATAGGYLTDEKVRELLTMDHKAGFTRWGRSDLTNWSPRRQKEIREFLELMAWVFQQILEIREDTKIRHRMTVGHNLLVALKEYVGFAEYTRQHRLDKSEVQSREEALRRIVKLARQGDWCWMGSDVLDVEFTIGVSTNCYIIAPDEQTSFDESQALPETRYFLHLFKQLALSV